MKEDGTREWQNLRDPAALIAAIGHEEYDKLKADGVIVDHIG